MGRNAKTKTARRIARQIVKMHQDKAEGKEPKKGPAPRAGEKLAKVTLAAVRKEFKKVWLEKSAQEKAEHDAKVTAYMASVQPAYDVEAQREADAEEEIEAILNEIENEEVEEGAVEELKAESARLKALQELVEESEKLGLYKELDKGMSAQDVVDACKERLEELDNDQKK